MKYLPDIPYAYQNEIYIRNGEQTIRADVEAIRNMVTMSQIEPERWERRFSSTEIEADISRDEIGIAVKQIIRSSVMKLRDKDDMMKILEDLSVARYGRLTNAGDVLFAENPAFRYPQIRTKAVCLVKD
ncbi:MAG: hypothetical protein SCM11_20320 [Bacillota bacterium]|nr:hypothetical protein [Bacillota bacterium]